MKIRREIVIIAAAVMGALSGCSGSDKSSEAATAEKVVLAEIQENMRFDNTELKRQVFDMNNDGQIDLWKYYTHFRKSDTEGEGELIIARKELDVNFDGRVDRIMYYNQKEELVSEEIDTDFNGSIDRIHYYDNALVVKTEFYQKKCNRIKIDGENNPEVFPNLLRFYRQGVLTREELDEKCDGIHESVTIFNADGGIAQIGLDQDGDGVVENWTRY